MDLLKLLQDLLASISVLQAQLADVPAALEAAKKASYDEGFAAGVASVPPPASSDKIYSQAELDIMLEPLKAKVAELQAQVDQIPSLVDAAVKDAKAGFLASMKDIELKVVEIEQKLQ